MANNHKPQWRFVNLTLEGVLNRQLVFMAVNCFIIDK